MEIRYFQIIIPAIAVFFIYTQFKNFRKNEIGLFEVVISVIFWFGVVSLAIFPDFFSDLLARVFGIKDNINAIMFSAISLLFYFQFRIYKVIKKQNDYITKLTRKIAIEKTLSSR